MDHRLFQEGTPPEAVVRLVFTIMQAHHEREAERLTEILSGFPEFCSDKLALTWLKLQADCQTDEEALGVLTRIVMAELDGGTCPMLPE